MSLRHPMSALVAIAAVALHGTSATAQESEVATPTLPYEIAQIEEPDVSPPEVHILSLEELAQARGRATIVISNQTLQAITSGNQLGSFVAGSINLSDNALSSFSGVGNFLFNTGAQNNLQSGMSLTITIE